LAGSSRVRKKAEGFMKALIAVLFLLFAVQAGAQSDPVATWSIDLVGDNVRGAGYITFDGSTPTGGTLTGYAILRPVGQISGLNTGFFLLDGTWALDSNGKIVGIFEGADADTACGPADATFSGSFKGSTVLTKKSGNSLRLTMTTNDGPVEVKGFIGDPVLDIVGSWQAKLTITKTTTSGTGTAAATKRTPTPAIAAVTAAVGSGPTDTQITLGTVTLRTGHSTTATVTVINTGSGTTTTPTGTVTITSSGTDTITTSPCTLDGTGQCTASVTASSTVGAHTITATYNGDTDHATSTGTVTLTVQQSATKTQSKTLEFLEITDSVDFGDPDVDLPFFFKVAGTGPAYDVTGCALLTRDGKIFMITTEDAGDTTRFVSGKLKKAGISAPLAGFDDDQGAVQGVMNLAP
jgi:Bacterial Ig-like domain (group 3)